MKKSLFAFAGIAMIALQGCVWSPGQYLDPDDFEENTTAEDGNDASVNLVKITPEVVQKNQTTIFTINDQQKRELLSYKPTAYRIGPNDLLYITVWDHPELTAPSGPQQQIDANGRLVRADGTLFYPYIGTIKAEGMTVEELRAAIARRLASYIDSPQVDVGILRYGSQRVVLSGAFKTAGEIPVTGVPISIVQVLGQAGVATEVADLTNLSLRRDGREYILNIDSLNRPESWLYAVYLKHGDQIHLPYNDQKKIYVLGEIKLPQAMTFKATTLNLMDAIGSAGGLAQETANAEAVYVIRGVRNMENEKATVFKLNAKSPASFALARHFMLQPQDVVYIGPASITRWNRYINQLIPSATFVGTGANAKYNFSQ
ncbi:polysaccharide biosynthesis/export family protein [Azomonas macrocytogenes]|uniref:Polysaccharide export outer membrane protein n=1 Tax=Azomonas macrocytogenes TaxID=69962 RepID=A0A839T6Y8_AZOMA|nr:polysaccharide biosynthesis/export family protein [Azomonas macrocytogenes]MBB3104839.1 polysaccharide export outer membrane protein [Azomonas macrocytogenes]